jgi:hypothetical protein
MLLTWDSLGMLVPFLSGLDVTLSSFITAGWKSTASTSIKTMYPVVTDSLSFVGQRLLLDCQVYSL